MEEDLSTSGGVLPQQGDCEADTQQCEADELANAESSLPGPLTHCLDASPRARHNAPLPVGASLGPQRHRGDLGRKPASFLASAGPLAQPLGVHAWFGGWWRRSTKRTAGSGDAIAEPQPAHGY
ncbi:hypothetical protein ON010_g9733 [Phytophthora cinnamomi]|nr:hypothetical protein ON010_g9733 [Phytophthora cinnamomi]